MKLHVAHWDSPLVSLLDSASREAMDPDTYDWAYVDTVANTGQGATGRVKVVCKGNAIDGAGTTTYTWSFQGGNSAVLLCLPLPVVLH